MLKNLGPLVGRLSRADLESIHGWEGAWAAAYQADAAALAAIQEHAPGVEMLVFVGTWCPDCRRELPRFFKLLDQAGLGALPLTLIGVDWQRRDPEELATRWAIRAVPTFVMVEGGRELGRVIERPATTLEGDIARILRKGF